MNGFFSWGLLVLAQVTAITAAAAIMMILVRRRSAFRHAVGVAGLGLLSISPLLALTLPQPWWLPDQAPRRPASPTVYSRLPRTMCRSQSPARLSIPTPSRR